MIAVALRSDGDMKFGSKVFADHPAARHPMHLGCLGRIPLRSRLRNLSVRAAPQPWASQEFEDDRR